nr:GNAT family N-acetyltransferase [Paracidobacterium acidisoli]
MWYFAEMNFLIRRAEAADAASIACVHVESWKSTYAGIVPADFLASLRVEERTEAWREWIGHGNPFILIAEDNSGIFGFAGGGKLRGEIAGYDAELYALYLLPQHQRRGAGTRLVRALAKELKGQNFQSLAVWVLERNPSREFYARLGGIPIARQSIDIGGESFEEIAFGWPRLSDLA